MRNVAADMPVIEVEADHFRLIPSRFPPVSVYEGLVANDRIERLATLEARTNPRLLSEERLLKTHGDPASPRLQNWNLAPFKYVNPEGSRFFGPTRPALELADDRQTALAVSVARRQAFLSRTDEPATGLDMRMLRTPVKGRFLDMRSVDPDLSGEERWRLGRDVDDDLDGVLYRPPERPAATCVAVLKGTALGRSIQASHYRFVWSGHRITALYAFDDAGRSIDVGKLNGAEDALAA